MSVQASQPGLLQLLAMVGSRARSRIALLARNAPG